MIATFICWVVLTVAIFFGIKTMVRSCARLDELEKNERIYHQIIHNMYCDIDVKQFATDHYSNGELVGPVARKQDQIEVIIKTRIQNEIAKHTTEQHPKPAGTKTFKRGKQA